ncbi:hypothetical protein COOONC_07643 [Cooperia oncophora]
MDAPRDFSPIARSLLLAPSREVVHGARVGEIALVQPVAEQHYRSESCLCIALHAIPHNMLVTDVLSNFRGRHLFTPDAKAVIANVEQFLAKLKEHLGATARETVPNHRNNCHGMPCECTGGHSD